jgi:hypothetical protein
MAYLTEAKLLTTVDLPVALPTTLLVQGDWLVVATIKIIAPMRLTYRWLNLQLHSASVDTTDINATNRIYGNLGFAYVALRKNYISGSPGEAGALDTLIIESVGVVARDVTNTVTMDTAGNYSWILANNMQPSTDSLVSASSSIDFRLSVTGQARLLMDPA